jgi:HNH endonuclease
MSELCWSTPQIETIFSIVPGEIISLGGEKMMTVKRHVATANEDLRPGKEGRKAPRTLVNAPSIEKLRELLEYDGVTGILRWKNPNPQARCVKRGDEAGSVIHDCKTSYRQTEIGGIGFKNHIIAFVIYFGRWPKSEIDHINHDGLDNSIRNLRENTPARNSQNRRGANKGAASLYQGVGLGSRRKKWYAVIAHEHLGVFPLTTEGERLAALTYDRAAIYIYGDTAHTNSPAYESEHIILPERVLHKLQKAQNAGAATPGPETQ